MMILKTSAHPDDAKKFIDYVLSDAGQALVAKTQLMPARADVTADRPLIADLKILEVDPKTDRKAVLDHFAKTFGME
jgi:iron(III) transport system substrate-binding protein